MENCDFVRKFGKYELWVHQTKPEYVLTDGWLCDWFILYDFGGWAHDGRFRLRKDVRAWFDRVSPKQGRA